MRAGAGERGNRKPTAQLPKEHISRPPQVWLTLEFKLFPSLASNLHSSRLSLPSAEILGVNHHASKDFLAFVFNSSLIVAAEHTYMISILSDLLGFLL